jgi:hypothetical protein
MKDSRPQKLAKDFLRDQAQFDKYFEVMDIFGIPGTLQYARTVGCAGPPDRRQEDLPLVIARTGTPRLARGLSSLGPGARVMSIGRRARDDDDRRFDEGRGPAPGAGRAARRRRGRAADRV